jgi:glycolate oxidase
LAVITAATLRLTHLPKSRLSLAMPFTALEPAAQAVGRLFTQGVDPSACELLEARALELVSSLESLPPQLATAAALLLIELEGEDKDLLLRRAATADQLVPGDHRAGEPMVALDAAEQRRLWRLRERVGEAIRQFSIYKEADTVVPRSQLAALVKTAKEIALRHELEAVCYGHAGDGNLHVNLLRGDLDLQAWCQRRDEAESELFQAVVALGGTISGEHGIGWTQRRYLPLALDATVVSRLRAVKEAFDPPVRYDRGAP